MTIQKSLTLLAAAAVLIPTLAFAEVSVGDKLGTTEAEIRASLMAAGYEVSSVEIEKDEIEIVASTGGKKFEIEIAPDTGSIAAIELDDDDEDEEKDG